MSLEIQAAARSVLNKSLDLQAATTAILTASLLIEREFALGRRGCEVNYNCCNSDFN